MQTQKLTPLNFEKIIIIIFFSESTLQKTQIKIGQCFGHLLHMYIFNRRFIKK
jgi:hypothetical protein